MQRKLRPMLRPFAPPGFRLVEPAVLSALSTGRDEIAFVWLIVVGAVVYAVSILLLFGKGWLRSLVR